MMDLSGLNRIQMKMALYPTLLIFSSVLILNLILILKYCMLDFHMFGIKLDLNLKAISV